MKKRWLLASALFIFMGSAVKAQTFNYGLKASLLFANVKGAGLKSNFSPGFQGGVYGRWDLSSKWAFQPEVLFSQSLSVRSDEFLTKYYVTKGNPDSDKKAKLSAVTVPVLFLYKVAPTFAIVFGGQYNYTFFQHENFVLYRHDAFKTQDVQAVLGLQVQVSNVHFFGRYALGLMDQNNISVPKYSWEAQQVAVGMGIDLGGGGKVKAAAPAKKP
jgi:hypothetical protein